MPDWEVQSPKDYIENPALCNGCNGLARFDRNFKKDRCTGRQFYVPKRKEFFCISRKNFLIATALTPGLQFILTRFDILRESDFIKMTPEELTPDIQALLEVLET